MNKTRTVIGIVSMVLLFLIAMYTPSLYFRVSDYRDRAGYLVIDQKVNNTLDQEVERDHIQVIGNILENSSATSLLALQKKEMTDIELNKLSKELNELVRIGLIKSLSVENLKEHLVYVAYYTMYLPSDETNAIMLKAFKFTDYNSFEYSFWMDGENDKIYEVTLVDDKVDFDLSEVNYMNGMGDYYGLDQITPMGQNNGRNIHKYQFEVKGMQGLSSYTKFSIYNPSTASFVLQEDGVQWSIFSSYFE